MKDILILVVEDDPVLRMLTQKQIITLGYRTEAVETGEEAVKQSRPEIRLIFMDIGLPGIDGGHATMLIREKELSEKRPRVPIIALTAHAHRAAGMDDFLQKPALLADIERMLVKWLPKIVSK